MYHRIYETDDVIVDYYNDGKPVLRISLFEDGHWKDEHFVDIPEGKVYEEPELRTCYCPLCDKHFEVRSNDSMGDCPDCGHHVVLHKAEVENE